MHIYKIYSCVVFILSSYISVGYILRNMGEYWSCYVFYNCTAHNMTNKVVIGIGVYYWELVTMHLLHAMLYIHIPCTGEINYVELKETALLTFMQIKSFW
jgi:hypothetical protein